MSTAPSTIPETAYRSHGAWWPGLVQKKSRPVTSIDHPKVRLRSLHAFELWQLGQNSSTLSFLLTCEITIEHERAAIMLSKRVSSIWRSVCASPHNQPWENCFTSLCFSFFLSKTGIRLQVTLVFQGLASLPELSSLVISHQKLAFSEVSFRGLCPLLSKKLNGIEL